MPWGSCLVWIVQVPHGKVQCMNILGLWIVTVVCCRQTILELLLKMWYLLLKRWQVQYSWVHLPTNLLTKMCNHCTTNYFSNHDSRHTGNSGITSQHPAAPSLIATMCFCILMSQANWLKNLIYWFQLNQQFSKVIWMKDSLKNMMRDLRKIVIKADGKVTVTALTFQWWGSNYIEGWFFFKCSIPFLLTFNWWKTNVNFDLLLAHDFQNNLNRLLAIFVWRRQK